jgi:hypothetical protein
LNGNVVNSLKTILNSVAAMAIRAPVDPTHRSCGCGSGCSSGGYQR